MKKPHQYHSSSGTGPRPAGPNQHRNATLPTPKTPVKPVMEVRRMACNYSTGKSQASPMGKPGMTKSGAC